MGQYWKAVNLDKNEYIDAFKLGSGIKLMEQLCNSPGVPQALFILCAAHRGARGGGDAAIEGEALEVWGRWAGNRIAIVGDYGQEGDIQADESINAGEVYGMARIDISELVAPEVARAFGGAFESTDYGGKRWNPKPHAKVRARSY